MSISLNHKVRLVITRQSFEQDSYCLYGRLDDFITGAVVYPGLHLPNQPDVMVASLEHFLRHYKYEVVEVVGSVALRFNNQNVFSPSTQEEQQNSL